MRDDGSLVCAKKIVQDACASRASSFYRDLYDSKRAGLLERVKKGTFSWDELPLLSRADLARVPFALRLYKAWGDIDAIRPTSGTSGREALIMPRLYFSMKDDQSLFTSVKRDLGIMRVASMSGAQFLYDPSFREIGVCSIGLDPGDMDASAALCDSFKPDLIAGTCHSLIEFLPHLRSTTIAGIRALLLFGEWHSKAQTERLAEMLPHAAFITEYASIELQMTIALTCAPLARARERAMHVVSEFAHAEVINPDSGASLQRGTGELVVTTLRDSAFPLIRYRTGDLVSICDKACICGSNALQIAVEGREEYDRVRVPAGEINLAEVERVLSLLLPPPAWHDFQVVVKSRGGLGITIRLPSLPDGLFLSTFMEALRIAPSTTYRELVDQGVFVPIVGEILIREGAGKPRRLVRED